MNGANTNAVVAPLLEAIALTNTGGLSLREGGGNNIESIASFQKALSILRGCYSQAHNSHVTMECNDVCHLHPPTFTFPYTIHDYHAIDDIRNQGSFYFFDIPMFLSFQPDEHCASDASTVHAISTAVLFNMALAFHLQAKMTGNATLYYQKAARLYNVLLKVLEKLGNGDNDANADQWMIWKVLVLNNRACLYHEHAEYQQCEACLEELLVVLKNEPVLLQNALLPPPVASAIKINIFHRRSPGAAGAA
jgi:tetratricopeptide (TPR) repeat protein